MWDGAGPTPWSWPWTRRWSPSAVQCGHAAATGVLEFHIPSFGTSPKTLVRAELTQGVALGEKFTVGYSDARSDCRSKRWISPRGQVVSRAIVSAHYSILVRSQTALLTNNRYEVVVTNEVRFKQTQRNLRRKRPTKTDSVSQAVFSQTAGEYEAFKDEYFGLYILRTKDVPTSDCESARTLWTSDAADIYVKKAGVPWEVADILRVGGKSNTTEAWLSKTQQQFVVVTQEGQPSRRYLS